MKLIPTFIAVVTLAALTACADPAPVPTYEVPAGITAQTGGSFIGSFLADPRTIRPNLEVFPIAVDNLAITRPVKPILETLKQPVLVAPGIHQITVRVCGCTGMLGIPSGPIGDVTLLVSVKAGETYTLHNTLPTGGTEFQPEYDMTWIEDSSGETVTPRTQLQLGPIRGSTGIIIIPVHH
jgi:hypothetical protein